MYTQLPGDDVKVVGEERLCTGRRFSLKRVTIEFRGRTFQRDLLEHPGSVAILPVLEDGSTVVLLRQWRPGCRCWLLEAPAGTIEPGEKPEETARRELLEETGLEALELVHLGVVYPSPGTSSEKMHLYFARARQATAPRPEQDEILEVFRMPFSRVYEMAVRGELVDAKTILLVLLVRAKGLV